ncbi:MAG: tetratricopeptide repeat protein [Candidatus Paceibacterota bacterium]
MFFIIPLGISLASLVLIVFIVSRKFTYLKRLSPEAIESSGSVQGGFWEELFPELSDKLKQIKIREYRVNFLEEFEKFLRRLRLISLRIDTLTNRMIHSVRKSTLYHEELLSKESDIEGTQEVKPSVVKRGFKKKEEYKKDEQQLIIEIAKDPKNPVLYKKLGQIYAMTGENEDAYQSFKKALELDPEDEDIKMRLDKVTAKLDKLPA